MKLTKSILSIFLIFTVLIFTACPSESAIQKSAKASSQLATLTLDAVRTTKTAYESQLISLETKDAIAAKLLTLSNGGLAFNTAVKNLQVVYQAGNLPPNELQTLSALFDSSVITPFLAILQDFGAIKNAPSIVAAIELIRTTVLTIAAVFGKTSLNLNTKVVMSNG